MVCSQNWARKNIPGQLFLTLANLVRVARVVKNEALHPYLGLALGSHVPKSGPVYFAHPPQPCSALAQRSLVIAQP